MIRICESEITHISYVNMPTFEALDVTAITTSVTAFADFVVDNAVLLIGVAVIITGTKWLVAKIGSFGRAKA
jgi:hypothetical protein